MKKALVIASLFIWTLGLVVGLGFAIAGEVTAINNLPAENQQLKREHKAMKSDRDSFANSLKIERELNVVRELMNNTLRFQNKRMLESLMEGGTGVTLWKQWPREE